MNEDDDAGAARQLIDRCLAGEPAAIRQFQESYGELIYAYPVRAFRVAAEVAGDFYVFAFDNGRIFRRLRTYAGRAPLRAYLLAVVLQHLFIDWRRAAREIDMVSLDDVNALADAAIWCPPSRNGGHPHTDPPAIGMSDLLHGLDPAKAIVWKLLHVEDCELDASDIRHLTAVSQRSVPDVLAAVEHLRAIVRERESGLQQIVDVLEAVQMWIALHRQRLDRLARELRDLPPQSIAAARVRSTAARINAQMLRREQQRARLLAEKRRRKITAPYKDIAAVLNTSIGNVASQIARVRQELAQRASGISHTEERDA